MKDGPPMPDEHQPEGMAVQLTRMEGKLGLVLQMVTELGPRVTLLETGTAHDRLAIQRLELEAKAERDKAVALATALEKAKEVADNEAQQPWTPIQRLGWFVGAALVLVQFYQYLPGN